MALDGTASVKAFVLGLPLAQLLPAGGRLSLQSRLVASRQQEQQQLWQQQLWQQLWLSQQCACARRVSDLHQKSHQS